MKVAIYGAGKYGHYIREEIASHECAKVTVVFWIDNFVEKQEIGGLPVYPEKEFMQTCRYKEIDAVIVAINEVTMAQNITASLLLQGYDQIYIAYPEKGLQIKVPVLDEKGDLGSFLKYYKDFKPVMPKLEISVTNYCNLHCRRCGNFSNLVNEKDILDLDKFEQYLICLKEKFSDMLLFSVLGGEPLLNPQLEKYILLLRRYFPHTKIRVTTNGLLLTKISQKLIDTMVQCNVYFHISQYPPTREKLDGIIDFLKKNQVSFYITTPVTEFRKMISLKQEGGERTFGKYSDCICHVLDEGRIYMCGIFQRLYAVQDYFGVHIEEGELKKSSIDLMSDEVDGWDIIKYFNRPVSLCRFCSCEDVWVPWELGQPQKADWLVD